MNQRTFGFDDSKGALSPINMSGIMSPSNMFEQQEKNTNTNHDLDSVLDKMSGNTNIMMQKKNNNQDANQRANMQ